MAKKILLTTLSLAVLMSLFPAGQALEGAGAHVPKSAVKPTTVAVESGMEASISKRTITIWPGSVWVSDKKFTFPEPVTMDVPPCKMLRYKDDPLTFAVQDGKCPAVTLNGCRASESESAVIQESLLAPSVKVKSAPGQAGDVYKPGIDYLIKGTTIGRTPSSAIKENQTVYLDYQCWTRAVDTVIVDVEGKLKILEGETYKSAPEPPELPKRALPLFNIYCTPFDKPLLEEDLLPIQSLESPLISLAQRQKNEQALARTLKKLESEEPVTVVFWGDSITAGADARDKAHQFAEVASRGLKEIYPLTRINLINAGIGGSDTRTRLPYWQDQVLKYKPDLIILEFINDIRLPIELVKKNHERILAAVKAKGIDLMLVTPHFPVPSIVRAKAWDSFAQNPYIDFLRKEAKAENVALCDISFRWENLDKIGLRPDMMLVDEIIHPNNYGHAIYAKEILKCFPGSRRR